MKFQRAMAPCRVDMSVLDCVGFQLEGGYLDPSRDRWMVWADRIEPYTVSHWFNPEATPTVWHPDWPVWGRGLTKLDQRYRPGGTNTLLDSAGGMPLSEGQGCAVLCSERRLRGHWDTLSVHCGE
jgi:hypothetical protein